MNRATRRRMAGFLRLGSISGVVNQPRPPVQSDFGGGGLQSPIYVNALTGECFIYVNGTITPINTTNVKAFGAKGDGVTNDTAAFQAAANAATVLLIPDGNYLLGHLTLPATLRAIRGVSAGTVTLTGVGLGTSNLMECNGSSFLEMSGFTVNVALTFSSTICIYLTSCSTAYLHDIKFTNAGACAIRGDACSDVLVERVTASNWVSRGIDFQSTVARVWVRECKVFGTGVQSSHNISIAGASFAAPALGCLIDGCYGTNNVVGSFVGVISNASHSSIQDSTAFNGVAEGFNLQNCDTSSIEGNVVYCASSSSDFGISLFGDGVGGGACTNCLVEGNTIYRPGKAGIAFASNVVGCSAIGNRIYNPNQLNQAQWGGVTLYGGSICNNNVVQGNSIYDTTAKCKYAANEYNDGTGNPNNNQLLDNPVQATGLTAETAILGANSITSQIGWSAFATVVTPTATPGTFSATVNSFLYRIRGKTGEIQYDISVPTNSTGAGAIQFTLPTGFNAMANGGVLSGREINVTGSNTSAQCSGAAALVRTYNNAYPASDGARMVGSGIYKIA